MQFTLIALLAAPLALAAPVNNELVRRQAGGLGKVLTDHNKFVSDPKTANVPIPSAENNPLREGHRQIHVALGPASAAIPPIPLLPGLGAGAASAAVGAAMGMMMPGQSGLGAALRMIPGLSGLTGGAATRGGSADSAALTSVMTK